MKQYLFRLIPSLFVLLLFSLHVTGKFPLQLIDKLEQFAYDTRLKLTTNDTMDKRIVIVDVDETSLREEGRWPWSRRRLADLVYALFDDYDIGVLGFDVFFFEAEGNTSLNRLKQIAEREQSADFLQRLEAYSDDLDADNALADAITDKNVVLSYFFGSQSDGVSGNTGLLPAPVFGAGEYLAGSISPQKASYYVGNIDVLQRAARSVGFTNLDTTDSDGVVRRAALLHEYNGELYSSFALSVAKAYTNEVLVPFFVRDTAANQIEAFELDGRRIPVDNQSNVLIPYRGIFKDGYPYVSAADVLHRRVPDPEVLRDAIALVGTSAAGLGDLKPTPVQEIFPGVEIHANIVSGILDGDFKHRPSDIWRAELGLLLFIGILLTVAMPMLGPVAVSIFVMVVLAATVSVNFYLWIIRDLDLPLASSVLLILFLAGINAAYGFTVEFRLEHQLRKAFSTYLAPALVEQLVKNPAQLRLQGETRVMTFLFTDVASFTSFVERSPPEQVVAIHNEYLDNVCRIIMDEGGTIDKIVGDAVIAIFNAPLDQPDHALRAVNCALALDKFGREFVTRCERNNIAFGHTRIGVNTGSAVVGNFGGQRRFDYTAYGDVVNITARLEAANKALGTRICVAESTVQQCPDMRFRPIGQLLLRGKETAVAAFEPYRANVVGVDAETEYREAYAQVESGSDQALEAFRRLSKAYPNDSLVKLYLNRLRSGIAGTKIDLSSE